MKTYPIKRADGYLQAFEIGNSFVSIGTIKRLLRSVPGVSDLKRSFRSDDRLTFTLYGALWVVHEPWGDSSRYWIGPKDPAHHFLRVEDVHNAFLLHRGPFCRLVTRLNR